MEYVATRGDAVVTSGSENSPVFEALEGRLLLDGAAPTFNTDIPDQWMLTPGSRGLTIGVDGDDADGDSLTISASSSNPLITVSAPYDQTITPIIAVLHFTAGDGVTPIGDITVQLLQGHASESLTAVERFITLATTGYDAGGAVDPTGDPFYTNVLVHRVIDDFMIQTGDPANGDGTGGSPLGDFNDSFDPALGFQGIGVLAMANSGANTNDSQFFITEGPTSWLAGVHMIFGQVISGWDMLQQISEVRVDANGKPRSNILLASIDISNSSQDGSLEFTADAAFTGSADITITLDDGNGNTVEKVITVTASSELGTRPTVDLTATQATIYPGSSGQVTASFTDDLGATIKKWIEVDVPGLVGSVVNFDSGTGEISINIPTDFDVPSFTVTVYAEEAGDYANLEHSNTTGGNAQQLLINVAGNPVISDVPTLLTLAPGQSQQVTPILTDASPREVVFSAQSSDPNVTVSIDPATNQVTIDAGAGASGLCAVTLSAIESGFNSDLAPTTKTMWVVVQNFGDPFALGMIDLADADQTMGTAMENNILYVARGDAGLEVYDVSDPSAPVLLSSLNVDGQAWDVEIQHAQRAGQDAIIAYVAIIDSGTAVVDVTDPANIQLIDTLGTGSASISLRVMGNLLLQSDWAFGLVVWDITDPYDIQLTQTIQEVIPASDGYVAYNLGYAVACDVQGDKAYVADANGALFIITIDSPTTYSVDSFYVTDPTSTGNGSPWDVVVQNDVAYILDEFQGLIALDVSNPAEPELISSLAISEMDWSHLAVSGTLAVLSTLTGYQFVDLSDPANMSVAYDFYAPTWGGQASIDGTMLALPFEQAAGVLIVTVGPHATGEIVNGGMTQRTKITSLAVSFNKAVVFETGALSLTNLTTGQPVDISAVPFDQATGTWDFSDIELTDGYYAASISSGAVHDLAGNPMPADYTFSFHRLAGDTTGDAAVDAADYIALKQNFGAVDGAAWDTGDLDGDGNVGWSDLQMLIENVGASLGSVPTLAPTLPAPTPADPVQASVTEPTESTMASDSPSMVDVLVEQELPTVPATEVQVLGTPNGDAPAEPQLSAAPVADAPDVDVLAIAASALSNSLTAVSKVVPLVTVELANLLPPLHAAVCVGSLSTSPLLLPSADWASQAFANVFSPAAPWWHDSSARYELPDEPLTITSALDIAGRLRKDRLEPIGLECWL